jgi:hypothetical protein
MAKLTPEQEARYALELGMRREDLRGAVQAEYDRLRPAWEARARAVQAECDRLRLDWLRELREQAGAQAAEPARVAGGDGPVARPGSHVRRMSGDQVRNTGFVWGFGSGYDASQVDHLLHRLAAELDAGRPAEPLIRRATFTVTTGSSGYEIAAVDWFLEELLRREDQPGPDQMTADPWRDLPVVNRFTRTGPSGAGAQIPALARRDRRVNRAEARQYSYKECQGGRRDFDQLPGVRLWWKEGWNWWHGADGYDPNGELRTADQQVIASVRGVRGRAVAAGGRNFTWKKVRGKRYSDPVIAGMTARAILDCSGHFDAAAGRRIQQAQQGGGWGAAGGLTELTDEAGAPILYTTGVTSAGNGMAGISFPDQRRLRFRIRGTNSTNATMTAVDQAGNRIARYRITDKGISGRRGITVICVNPSWNLTDDLVLAIAVSACWLTSAFWVGSEDGERRLD